MLKQKKNCDDALNYNCVFRSKNFGFQLIINVNWLTNYENGQVTEKSCYQK
jgi:hypothetical protein